MYTDYFSSRLMDFCMNVPNSCMTRKDKYYVFLNVLKFEEYIVYVKVQIWIWWKCWVINLLSNSPKSLLNFVNLLKFSNLLNIEKFINNFFFEFSTWWKYGTTNPTRILRAKCRLSQTTLPPLSTITYGLMLKVILLKWLYDFWVMRVIVEFFLVIGHSNTCFSMFKWGKSQINYLSSEAIIVKVTQIYSSKHWVLLNQWIINLSEESFVV